MAKKTKAPINMICDRYSNYCANKNEFDFDEWMRSFDEHRGYTNDHIYKAIKNNDKEEMYFCMEHLIHERCDIDFSRKLVKYIREVEWIK